MCGICGIFHPSSHPDPRSIEWDNLRRMNDALTHRGLDGEGYFVDDGIGMAMRRLSVIDVAGSDQPLYNEDKSIALVFNGEIFNFRELRHQLTQKGHRFRTEGDGETIIHLYEEHGLEAPKYLKGQFAFSLWDSKEKRLVLGRDWLGEKPLFYYYAQPFSDLIVWGSEIKAILQHPDVKKESLFQHAEALNTYLVHGYLPTDEAVNFAIVHIDDVATNATAYNHIYEVPPGTVITFYPNYQLKDDVKHYRPVPKSTPADPNARIEDYLPSLRAALENAVDLTMIADVPLGAFLSGGLDSSLIVAIMQRKSTEKVKTFSIGFEGDDSFDETRYARKVADLLGTDHTEFRVKSADMFDLLPELVKQYDQPFADSSALPTYYVSKLTRQHVTVALTGDGGDELFAGYERFYALSLVEKLGFIPKDLWRLVASFIDRLPEGTGYYNKVKRAGRFVRGASLPLSQAYVDFERVFTQEQIVALGIQPASHHNFIQTTADALTYNLVTYLPGDLLVKTDRMTMMNSLEARAPFLYPDVVEFAFMIPFNLKLKGSTTKHILKELARDYLPAEIIHRPKHGFGVPVGAWLRQDSQRLRDILLAPNAHLRGLLDINAVKTLVDEHVNGQRDHARRLWALLTLEVWHGQL
jgi:asparagine synthase (glutamine-hydrolysing)